MKKVTVWRRNPEDYCARGHRRPYHTICPKCVQYWETVSMLRRLREQEAEMAEIAALFIDALDERTRRELD